MSEIIENIIDYREEMLENNVTKIVVSVLFFYVKYFKSLAQKNTKFKQIRRILETAACEARAQFA